jgi:hypothetical protein
MGKIKSISFILGVLLMSFLVGYFVFAWVEPGESPPYGNVPAPLNVSNTGQSKGAGLILNTGGALYGLIVQNGNVGIGTTEPGYLLHVDGSVAATAFYYTSDERLKENIKPLEASLSKILKLNGISYRLKETGEEKIGLSAQEVKQVFPKAVNEDKNGMLSIDSSGLIASLVEAIKEQQKEIEELKEIIENIK